MLRTLPLVATGSESEEALRERLSRVDKILKSPQAAAILRATSVGRFEAQAGELIENLGEKLERASVEDAPPPPSSPAAVGSERPKSRFVTPSKRVSQTERPRSTTPYIYNFVTF